MVQGGLLTAHPGSVHGYVWSPGGGVSFRQGAGAASPGSPDLEMAARWNREGFAKKGSLLGVSTPRGKYRRRGASRGPTRQPGGLLARPRVGPRQGLTGINPGKSHGQGPWVSYRKHRLDDKLVSKQEDTFLLDIFMMAVQLEWMA